MSTVWVKQNLHIEGWTVWNLWAGDQDDVDILTGWSVQDRLERLVPGLCCLFKNYLTQSGLVSFHSEMPCEVPASRDLIFAEHSTG